MTFSGSRGRIRTFGRGSKVLCLTSWPPGSLPTLPWGFITETRDLDGTAHVASGDEKRVGRRGDPAYGRVRRLPISGRVTGAGRRYGQRPRPDGPVRAGREGRQPVRRPAGAEPGARLLKRGEHHGEGRHRRQRQLLDRPEAGELRREAEDLYARDQRSPQDRGRGGFQHGRQLRAGLRHSGAGGGAAKLLATIV